MTDTPIDAATVQRCIDALRSSGEYRRDWKGNRCTVGYSGELVETWTFTTHPMDILAALLPPPEKSEAEKLVDEWQVSSPWSNDSVADFDIDDLQSLAQFILDKQKAHLKELIAPSDMPVVEKPQYIFGPWIEWHGGECPVPGDWIVETVFRYEAKGSHDTSAEVASTFPVCSWLHVGPGVQGNTCDIIHYRVRFELNRWYDWTSGPCPVGDDVLIAYNTSNGCAGGNARASDLYWTLPSNGLDITRFKITSSGEAQ